MDLETSVVVVEWGDGLVSGLSDSPMVIRIARTESELDETRTVDIAFVGERWASARLPVNGR